MLRAVRHPANYKPIIFCTISMAAIGIILVVIGLVAVLIDHIEMGPPHFDALYARYEGSSLPGIIGPMFIVFGTLVIVGNLCTLAYAAKSYHTYLSESANTRR